MSTWCTITGSVSAVKVTALVSAIALMHNMNLKSCTGQEDLGAGGQLALKAVPKPGHWQCPHSGSVILLACKQTVA